MNKTFGAQSTTDEVLEGVALRGKRILVTGASAGLGIETCRALVACGAAVIGAARDLHKARNATTVVEAAAKASGGSFELVQLDLASLKSVRAASASLVAAGQELDIVIANAGVMACPQGKTTDGFETQFGTNHLGHFVFVNGVVPLIKRGGRIVMVSSAGHRFADVDLEDPGFESTTYHPFVAYGRSKTANILFAVGLDRRLVSKGIRALALHPGVIQTELGRHLTPDLIAQLMPAGAAAPPTVFKTIPQGAATSVWSAVVATAAEVGGRYCEDCHVVEAAAVGERVRAYALDSAHADALWAKSEVLVGESFPLS